MYNYNLNFFYKRTLLLDHLRNRRRYWELKVEKDGNGSLSIEHKEEIHIFHKFMDLLISSILNNNNNNNNNNLGIACEVMRCIHMGM